MNRVSVEIAILTINALGAGLLMFVAQVVQPIMDALQAAEFRKLQNALVGRAMTEPFTVTIATLPLVAAIPYFLAYGFERWWFTAGFAVWIAGSIATKILNLPTYRWLSEPQNTDPKGICRHRRHLRLGNRLRAWLTLASVLLMACQFDAAAVGLTVVASAMLAMPLVSLARRFARDR